MPQPPRPELPVKFQNPNLKSLDLAKWPPVKYQSLDRDGHEVLVGRLKIPTPSGHAFILRRYDTGAISLTTMFRAAFPDASELDERRETQWAKEAFDLSGNNGSARDPAIVRLAGTWISPTVALDPQLADAYRLHDVIHLIAKASPDPKATYRRSNVKGTPKATSTPTTTPVKALITPAPSMSMPTPKRRRESSPASTPAQPPAQQQSSSSLPPPRRSARTKSPASAPAPLPAPVSVKSSKPVRIARAVRVTEATTPAGSDETIVEEEAETIELAKPSMTQDIAEQKELIDRLKAERDLQKTHAMQTDEPVHNMDPEPELAPAPLKREREEEDQEKPELRFNFKEPETEERQIVTNKRVSRFQMEPQTKSVAWGVAAFAIGMGAVSFLPNFF